MPDEPDMILLADPTILVERSQWGELAIVTITLHWPMTNRPDHVIPLTPPTARLIGMALQDCARPASPADGLD